MSAEQIATAERPDLSALTIAELEAALDQINYPPGADVKTKLAVGRDRAVFLIELFARGWVFRDKGKGTLSGRRR